MPSRFAPDSPDRVGDARRVCDVHRGVLLQKLPGAIV
jgi:hypothetical protein